MCFIDDLVPFQGLENIAALSFGIDYDNVVTKRLKLR